MHRLIWVFPVCTGKLQKRLCYGPSAMYWPRTFMLLLFLCFIVSRLTFSLRVIPIGVYSSITYIDFVLQYLNNNNSSSKNNNVNNIKEMLQVKSLQWRFFITFLHLGTRLMFMTARKYKQRHCTRMTSLVTAASTKPILVHNFLLKPDTTFFYFIFRFDTSKSSLLLKLTKMTMSRFM